jgi:uncharacterized membrane protein YqaE (UPF0057 family)
MFENWKADIPSLPKGLGIILLILNIFFPPIGTFLLGCVGNGCRPKQLLVGILQLLTLGILIGWIWSVWWGILIMEKTI